MWWPNLQHAAYSIKWSKNILLTQLPWHLQPAGTTKIWWTNDGRYFFPAPFPSTSRLVAATDEHHCQAGSFSTVQVEWVYDLLRISRWLTCWCPKLAWRSWSIRRVGNAKVNRGGTWWGSGLAMWGLGHRFSQALYRTAHFTGHYFNLSLICSFQFWIYIHYSLKS